MAETLMTQVPADHPLMIAWEAWKKAPSYENAQRWAGGQHASGSLWAAFERGFIAASLMPHPNPPGGPEANPAGEALYQAMLERSRAEFPEEREAESLQNAIRFIERWMPDSLPANEHGQVSFGRALLEMALDAMKAALNRAGPASNREHIQDEAAAVVLAHHVLGMQMGTVSGQRARQLARQVLGIPDHGDLAGCTAITTNGTLRIIPADEPVFLLRGQDVVAADTVRWWVEQAENVGAAPDIIAMALAHADRMEAWPKKKIADLSPALAQAGAARG